MSRFLFTPLAEVGHVLPVLDVATTLEAAGHEVVFYGPPLVTELIRDAGIRGRCLGSAEPWAAGSSRDRVRMLRDPIASRKMFALAIRLGRAQVDAIRAAVDEVEPDVMVVDPVNWAAAWVAEQVGARWAAVATNFLACAPVGFRCRHLDLLAEHATEIEQAFPGLQIRRGDVVSPWINSVFTTQAFAPREDNPESIYAGPASQHFRRAGDFAWSRLRDDRALVYVSFGSHLVPEPATFAAIAAAIDPAREQAVVVVGDEEIGLPEHIIGVRRAPQLEMLDRAAVMVSHGGASSVTECLVRGKPLIVVPLAFDQPLQALLVERCGAGTALELEQVTTPRLRTALDALGGASESAARIGRSLAAADGSARVAELVVELTRR